jgi:hypothetical protein
MHSGGDPHSPTPLRRPGSVRRTTTHDSLRPDGIEGRVANIARGRDLLTLSSGAARVLDEARVETEVPNYRKGEIGAIAITPHDQRIANFVGASIYGGFRKILGSALPGESDTHSVRYQLLDELPAAILQSGRALRAAGVGLKLDLSKRPSAIDVCSGWAEGGTLLAGLTEFGPVLVEGPKAPALTRQDDALAWHEVPLLPVHSTRRLRRLDIWKEDGRGFADCFFRDSHIDLDGAEKIVHEWRLEAAFDLETRLFVSGEAQTGPLPYPECPRAAASAGRLAGMPIDGMRRAVPKVFTGPSTCTHLNDTFRAMEDVGALLEVLRAQN